MSKWYEGIGMIGGWIFFKLRTCIQQKVAIKNTYEDAPQLLIFSLLFTFLINLGVQIKIAISTKKNRMAEKYIT